jgi:hypothetical protein
MIETTLTKAMRIFMMPLLLQLARTGKVAFLNLQPEPLNHLKAGHKLLKILERHMVSNVKMVFMQYFLHMPISIKPSVLPVACLLTLLARKTLMSSSKSSQHQSTLC